MVTLTVTLSLTPSFSDNDNYGDIVIYSFSDGDKDGDTVAYFLSE